MFWWVKKCLFFIGMMDCDLLLNWIDIGRLVSVKGTVIRCSLILLFQSVMIGANVFVFLWKWLV